ncbi:MAG: hypothetical protein LBT38_05300 [Deltaproteobacteria bacterium]|nr:hypothetical protein [Deltaproteobacteria bacterium]
MPEPPSQPSSTLAETLFKHQKVAASQDFNPFRRGFQNQLISLLAPLFPEMDRLSSLVLNWTDNGWLSAEALYQIADLSQQLGPGLSLAQAPGQKFFLPALNPDIEPPWEATRPRLASLIYRCPLWGTCRGQRINHAELLDKLAAELAKEIDDGFRVELAGCPRDCRFALERADVGLILAEDGRDIQVWLGGRHRFGFDPLAPEFIRYFELTEAWPMLDLVFHIHDQWYANRWPEDETAPEMAQRDLSLLSLSAKLGQNLDSPQPESVSNEDLNDDLGPAS